MIEKLIETVSINVKKALGNEYKVYTEAVYQGGEKPCVFIECERLEKINLLGERYFLRAWLKVSLADDRRDKKHHADAASEALFNIMAKVCTDTVIIWGRNLTAKWENGDFTLRAYYDIYTQNKEETEMMEKIVLRQEVG